ncbi:uncharacterized protein LOC134205751 [Armigeres subalbatus]|uniref:uncharacterized protein LOC134205751 n=1 Tax=Armigeres subalbatus TaxID=124917 RepID=UPI002ED03C2F
MARQLMDQFWRRWMNEYLPTLANRTKWFGETKNLEKNDLVLIVNEGQRNGWLRGRVITTIPGRDGRIRQAWVQTTEGVFRRPVSKLAVLQVQGNGNAESVGTPEVRHGSGDVATTGSTANIPPAIRLSQQRDTVNVNRQPRQQRNECHGIAKTDDNKVML